NQTKVIPPELSILSLLRACWKRKFLLIGTWLFVGGATMLVVHQLPPIYTSEVLILVDPQKIPERFVSSTVQTDIQDRLATISQQMLSAPRLLSIINDFNLYEKERFTMVQEEIILKMRKEIAVKLERGWTGNKPGAFRIGYEGRDPVVVAQVANRIA